MAASGNLSTSDSALTRKKQEILARSMALFDQEITQWLDKSFSEPMKRVDKRARDDHDSGVEDGSTSPSPKQDVRNTKKRARREPRAATTGPHFACPFYSHDPAKYKAVKTCCGPGWTNVHRLKEHIYRRHWLEHACIRCYDQFGSVEELNQHLRLENSCKRRDNPIDDVISADQQKQIRARAKTNQPEEDRWKDLYRILFPDAKIPSPYYETTTPKEESPLSPEHKRSTPNTPSTPTSGIANLNEFIHFKDEAEVLECRAHIHQGLRRAVRPVLEKEVEKLLRSVQHAMAQRVTDICKDVVTKIVRTWQFGAQQGGGSRAASPEGLTSYGEGEGEGKGGVDVDGHVAGPVEVSYEEFIDKTPSMIHSFLLEDGEFDLDGFLAAEGLDYGESFTAATAATASDSAYFSNGGGEGGGSMGRECFEYE